MKFPHWISSIVGILFFFNVCNSQQNVSRNNQTVDGYKGIWFTLNQSDSGPQVHGSGGEIVMRESRDNGSTWKRVKQLTTKSDRNHNYVRRVVNGKSPFMYFWADGDPNKFSPSYLYIGDANGDVWQLPYEMAV